MRWAICNELFEDWSLEAVCEWCSRLGYTGIEFAPFTLHRQGTRWTPAEAARGRRVLESFGLECAGLHWLLARSGTLHLTDEDPVLRETTIAHLRSLIPVCRELGGKRMILGSPLQRSAPPGVELATARDRLRLAVESLLPELESCGVVLALEPLGPEETNLLNTAAETVQLIRELDSPAVGLILDVKAMSTESIPIPDLISACRDQLVHFHANDPNRLGPGMGSVDFVPILAALHQIRYSGWVSVEAFDFSPGAERISRESMEHLQRAERLAVAG